MFDYTQRTSPTDFNTEAPTSSHNGSNQPSRGHIHIDRITVTGPLEHEPLGPVFYKEVQDLLGLSDLLPAGSQPYKPRRRKTPAQDDIFVHSKQIAADDRTAQKILLDCCPPRVLQAHNVFGHNDLRSYVYEIFSRQLVKHGLSATDQERHWWREGGHVNLSCIHLTGNHRCEPGDKPLIFKAIDQNNPVGKRRDTEGCITLGLTPKGERSQYHTLTIYDKHALLLKEWSHPGPIRLELLDIARRSVRAEMKLHAQYLNTYAVDPETREILNYREELKRDAARAIRLKRLSDVASWAYVDIDALFYQLLDRYNVNNSVQRLLTQDEEKYLSRRARRAYVLWLKGEDLSTHYGRSALSTYSREIREKCGVDITARRRPAPLPESSLEDIFCAEKLVPIPECILNTPYYLLPTNV